MQPILIVKQDGRLSEAHRGHRQRTDTPAGGRWTEQTQAGAPHDHRPCLPAANRAEEIPPYTQRDFLDRPRIRYHTELSGSFDRRGMPAPGQRSPFF